MEKNSNFLKKLPMSFINFLKENDIYLTFYYAIMSDANFRYLKISETVKEKYGDIQMDEEIIKKKERKGKMESTINEKIENAEQINRNKNKILLRDKKKYCAALEVIKNMSEEIKIKRLKNSNEQEENMSRSIISCNFLNKDENNFFGALSNNNSNDGKQKTEIKESSNYKNSDIMNIVFSEGDKEYDKTLAKNDIDVANDTNRKESLDDLVHFNEVECLKNIKMYAIEKSVRIIETKAYKEGKVYAIDLCSVFAVEALRLNELTATKHKLSQIEFSELNDVRREENLQLTKEPCRVLDMCCAPGMKLGMISEELREGIIYGVDNSMKRLRICRNLCNRHKHFNIKLLCADATTINSVKYKPLFTCKNNNIKKNETLYGDFEEISDLNQTCRKESFPCSISWKIDIGTAHSKEKNFTISNFKKELCANSENSINLVKIKKRRCKKKRKKKKFQQLEIEEEKAKGNQDKQEKTKKPDQNEVNDLIKNNKLNFIKKIIETRSVFANCFGLKTIENVLLKKFKNKEKKSNYFTDNEIYTKKAKEEKEIKEFAKEIKKSEKIIEEFENEIKESKNEIKENNIKKQIYCNQSDSYGAANISLSKNHSNYCFDHILTDSISERKTSKNKSKIRNGVHDNCNSYITDSNENHGTDNIIDKSLKDNKNCYKETNNNNQINENSELNNIFDRVLLDVECTHDASVKHLEKFTTFEGKEKFEKYFIHDKLSDNKLLKLQRKLIVNAYKLLKEDGLLIYSTCSFSFEQNEKIVLFLLNKFNYSAQLYPLPFNFIFRFHFNNLNRFFYSCNNEKHRNNHYNLNSEKQKINCSTYNNDDVNSNNNLNQNIFSYEKDDYEHINDCCDICKDSEVHSNLKIYFPSHIDNYNKQTKNNLKREKELKMNSIKQETEGETGEKKTEIGRKQFYDYFLDLNDEFGFFFYSKDEYYNIRNFERLYLDKIKCNNENIYEKESNHINNNLYEKAAVEQNKLDFIFNKNYFLKKINFSSQGLDAEKTENEESLEPQSEKKLLLSFCPAMPTFLDFLETTRKFHVSKLQEKKLHKNDSLLIPQQCGYATCRFHPWFSHTGGMFIACIKKCKAFTN